MPVADASTPPALDGEIEAADAAVGAVLDTLRRKGWYDDALVIVTSTYGGPPTAPTTLDADSHSTRR